MAPIYAALAFSAVVSAMVIRGIRGKTDLWVMANRFMYFLLASMMGLLAIALWS
jgi:hypothetical protein